MRIAPAVGISKPATMRRSWSCRSRDGPRKETNSPRSIARSKFCTTVCWPKILRSLLDLEKAPSSPRLRRRACHGAPCRVRPRPNDVDQAHAGPGDDEGDDRERRRLVGAVGADQLQVGAEGRPVEQARHGELADDDGEGQERAATARRRARSAGSPGTGSSASWRRGSAPPRSACARRSRAGRCRPRGTCRAAPASRS